MINALGVLNALDLAGIHPEMDCAPAIVPKTPLLSVRAVEDISRFTNVTAVPNSGDGATQSAWIGLLDGVPFYIKRNPDERLINTFYEIAEGRLLNDLGLPFNPLRLWVTKDGAICVASQIVTDADDVGPYLNKAAISHSASNPGIAAKLKQYLEAEIKVRLLAENKQIDALLKKYPKGSFDQLGVKEHAILQPLRDAELAMLILQEQIFERLPQEPVLRSHLLMAAYVGEVIGEWDFLNHRRMNTMIQQDKAGRIRVQTVDRGVSGIVGFSGRPRQGCVDQANQPARINDPYARFKGVGAPYLPAHFLPRDMDFTQPSPGFGLIGSTPRSASMAFIFRHVIEKQRDYLQISSDPKRLEVTIAPDGVPDEALQVAWLLKHRARPHEVLASISASWDACQGHPLTRTMLKPSVIGVASAKELATRHSTRIAAIVARAERSNALNRWANRHPAEARRILHEGELTGPL